MFKMYLFDQILFGYLFVYFVVFQFLNLILKIIILKDF